MPSYQRRPWLSLRERGTPQPSGDTVLRLQLSCPIMRRRADVFQSVIRERHWGGGCRGGSTHNARHRLSAASMILAARRSRPAHSESHIVELDDGSRWQIFPGDIDLTLTGSPRPI
jgi:hypothetical protein